MMHYQSNPASYTVEIDARPDQDFRQATPSKMDTDYSAVWCSPVPRAALPQNLAGKTIIAHSRSLFRLRRFRVCLSILLAIAWGQPALASLGKDYDTATLKISKGHYQEAIVLLEDVIADVPASQARIRLYGMRFSPYTPHYWLGVAYYHAGNCENAIRSWQAESRFNVTQSDENEEMKRLGEECLQQLGGVASAGEDSDQQTASEEISSSEMDLLQKRFLSGEYEAVAAADPAQYAQRDVALVWMYRAASHYVLYVLAGASDSKLMDTIQKELRSAITAAGGTPEIDRGQFPPKFLRVFDATK